ncbi:hypothetical protein AB6888_02510 [Carnobacterium maltaromaticum]
MTNQPQKEKKEIAFNSGEDFEEMKKRLITNMEQGGEDKWQQN